MKSAKMSIVIPAKNAETTIRPVLLDLSNAFPQSEIIVVCNNCTDNTYEIVNQIRRMNIVNIEVKQQIGKGGAILRGLELARNGTLAYIDADGSFDSSDVKKLLQWINKFDCVIASKWKEKSFAKVKWSLERKVFGRIWNILVKQFLNLDIEDTQAGLKIFRSSVYKSIDKDFICRGFDFDVEFLQKVHKKGFTIREISIEPKIKQISTFSFSEVPGMLARLLILAFKS